MIRVRLDEPCTDAGEQPPIPPPRGTQDWQALGDLVLAALLLAHRLRARQRDADAEPGPDEPPAPDHG